MSAPVFVKLAARRPTTNPMMPSHSRPLRTVGANIETTRDPLSMLEPDNLMPYGSAASSLIMTSPMQITKKAGTEYNMMSAGVCNEMSEHDTWGMKSTA